MRPGVSACGMRDAEWARRAMLRARPRRLWTAARRASRDWAAAPESTQGAANKAPRDSCRFGPDGAVRRFQRVSGPPSRFSRSGRSSKSRLLGAEPAVRRKSTRAPRSRAALTCPGFVACHPPSPPPPSPPPRPLCTTAMARMGPSPRHRAPVDGDALANNQKTLFHHFLPRYLHIPAVRAWLMDRSVTPTRYLSKLSSGMSYACMYYPPSALPRGSRPYPIPKPFLDWGDFMLCEHVFDSVAVGTLFNNREHHALAQLRDKMLPSSTLSTRPRTRRFAVDLSVSNLEIIEFAWMEDDSLIIACRRLDQPVPNGELQTRDLVLSGDFLFYDIIPPHAAPGVPLLRMTLSEKPAICQFCGTRGIKTCACPPSFKTRAPTPHSVPVPFAHAPFSNDTVDIVPQGPLAGILATWTGYTKRIFAVNTSGAFFVNWYKRSKESNGMSLFLSPPHPISYHFMCGSRKQTMCLASAYVKRMKLCERAYSADTRLYSYLSRGSDIGMIMDKQNTWPVADDLVGPEDVSDFTNSSPISSHSDERVFQLASLDDRDPYSVVDSASSQPSFPPEHASDSYTQRISDMQTGVLDIVPPSSGTLTATTGASSSGMSSADYSQSPLNRSKGWSAKSHSQNEQLSDDPNDKQIQLTPTSTPERRRHVMDAAFDAWGAEGHGTVGNTKTPSPPRGQRLTLSTTSRELQQYMTVDASNTPTCKECGSSFPKRGNLARHIQTVHLKLKPFQCEHCHASFGYKNHLKRHQIVHQRGSEFKCRVCNREFKGQVQLTRHIQQSHQKGVAEKGNEQTQEDVERGRVACDICGGKFSISCVLRICNVPLQPDPEGILVW